MCVVTLHYQESGKTQPTWRGHSVGPVEKRLSRRLFYTPYWTTFELPTIDMKAASVGMLDQIVTGLKVMEPPESAGRFSYPLPS